MRRSTALALLTACTALGAAPWVSGQGRAGPDPRIREDFPYAPHYVTVQGARLHYVDVGSGDPILLLHGNPTSSYLWRNVIPHLQSRGRVLALDNMGFGKSDKPPIGYTFEEHRDHLEAFVQTLGLRDIVIVGHDWGSALALDFAARNETLVKGVVWMEALIPPFFPITHPQSFPPGLQTFLRQMRDPVLGPQLVLQQNHFVEVILPGGVMRDLTETEMDFYRAPFPDPASRYPILVWPNQIPVLGQPPSTHAAMLAYGSWLEQTTVPKLHVLSRPGLLNPPSWVPYWEASFPNYEAVVAGPGRHFLQEDLPAPIGRAIVEWYDRL